jgi:hypothetical protein
MKSLEILSNQLIYKATPTVPFFGVTGNPERSQSLMLAEFEPFRMKVSDLRFEGNGPIHDQHVAIVFGIGYCKVAIDRVEASFSEFTATQKPEIMRAIESAQSVARKITPDAKFSSHLITYYCHARVEGQSFLEFIGGFPSPSVPAGGESLGTGFAFNWREPHRGWRTKLTVDASLAHPDALFLY